MSELPNTQTRHMINILRTYGPIKVFNGSVFNGSGLVSVRLVSKHTAHVGSSSDSYEVSIKKLYRRLVIRMYNTVMDIEGSG